MFLVVKFLKKEKQKFHLLILAEQKRFRIFLIFRKRILSIIFKEIFFNFNHSFQKTLRVIFRIIGLKTFFHFNEFQKLKFLKF